MIGSAFLILIGFVLLAKGADILVAGASAVAKRFRVSDLTIGLTIVALGTSAPELTVSALAAVTGNGSMALGNVMGSNIANLGLVLGLAGLLAPIRVSRSTVMRQIPYCVLTAIALLIAVTFFNGNHVISRVEAVVLLAGVAGYLLLTAREARRRVEPAEEAAHRTVATVAIMILAGLAGLIVGGDLIVRNAVSIAERLGISQQLIGVTIVAIGTSLPEVATSIAAVLKGSPDLAVGNVVGSNVLNTCLVLGTAGAIRPVRAAESCVPDAAFIVAATLILFAFMFTGQKHRLDRWEAGLFLVLYAGYLAFAVLRG